MSNDTQKQIEELKKFIAEAEANLEEAKKSLFNLTGDITNVVSSSKGAPVKFVGSVKDGGKIVEGIFNGENMIGPQGRIYPVPANYASKSKLVEGDKLKLTIAEDGTFIFKQIGPVPRKKIIGTLKFTNNFYQVDAEGKNYNILYASVTYFKAKEGNQVTIIVPEGNTDVKWAALENVINVPDGSTPKPEVPNTVQNQPNVQPQIASTAPPTAQPINTNEPQYVKENEQKTAFPMDTDPATGLSLSSMTKEPETEPLAWPEPTPQSPRTNEGPELASSEDIINPFSLPETQNSDSQITQKPSIMPDSASQSGQTEPLDEVSAPEPEETNSVGESIKMDTYNVDAKPANELEI